MQSFQFLKIHMMVRGNRPKITILEFTTSGMLTKGTTLFVGFGTSDTLRLPMFTFERKECKSRIQFSHCVLKQREYVILVDTLFYKLRIFDSFRISLEFCERKWADHCYRSMYAIAGTDDKQLRQALCSNDMVTKLDTQEASQRNLICRRTNKFHHESTEGSVSQ
jgi:hypothetical protein